MLKRALKLLFAAAGFIFLFLYVKSKHADLTEIDYKIWGVLLAALGYTVMDFLDLGEHIKAKLKKAKDAQVVKNGILQELQLAREQLLKLIPLMEDTSHENPIDPADGITAPRDLLTDHLRLLADNSLGKIENKEKIDLIIKWNTMCHTLNKKAHNKIGMKYRVEYIKENKSSLQTTLNELIDLFL